MRSLDIIIQPDIDTKERKDIREKEEFITHVIFILLLVYGLFFIFDIYKWLILKKIGSRYIFLVFFVDKTLLSIRSYLQIFIAFPVFNPLEEVIGFFTLLVPVWLSLFSPFSRGKVENRKQDRNWIEYRFFSLLFFLFI